MVLAAYAVVEEGQLVFNRSCSGELLWKWRMACSGMKITLTPIEMQGNITCIIHRGQVPDFGCQLQYFVKTAKMKKPSPLRERVCSFYLQLMSYLL